MKRQAGETLPSIDGDQTHADRNFTMPGAFNTTSTVETTTPKTKRSALSFLSSITQRTPKTPKDRTPIKPTDDEMHPQLHHKSTTTPYDEARWLGFFQMGSITEPTKTKAPGHINTTSPTPAKIHDKPAQGPENFAAPDFQFTFKRQPSLELSEEAKQLMKDSREEAAKIRAQMVADLPSVPETEPSNVTAGRKIAKPKGKAGRFSDVHIAEFKKMDSIANHPSLWRLEQPRPNHAVPNPTALKRSSSKAELDAPVASSLRRSHSKAELNAAPQTVLKGTPLKAKLNAPVTSSLKRMPSTTQLNASTTNTLKRSPSKAQLNSNEDSPFTSKPSTRFGFGMTREEALIASSAKRVKHSQTDDATTSRPVGRDIDSQSTPLRTTGRGFHGLNSGIPKSLSRAMTPTKAFLARTQSLKNLRTVNGMNPSLMRSKSTKNLLQPQTPPHSTTPTFAMLNSPTPAKIANFSHDTPVKVPSILTSPPSGKKPLSAIRSILRTPQRLYSDDPAKIAAGTHMATPPKPIQAFSFAPATAPVRKRVDFSSSTKETDEKEVTRSKSVEPTVTYPILPSLDIFESSTTTSTMESPGAFTFRSDHAKSFSPMSSGPTIRQVRGSDVGLQPFSFGAASTPKRKLGTLGEVSEEEKENQGDEDDNRPAKKARREDKPKPGKEVKKSRLPTRLGKRANGMTASRLQMLAMPKHRH
jgi:hypothetical protein